MKRNGRLTHVYNHIDRNYIYFKKPKIKYSEFAADFSAVNHIFQKLIGHLKNMRSTPVAGRKKRGVIKTSVV